MAGIRSTHDPLHYKLVTKFRKQYVVHNRGEPTEKRWKQERPLGEGGQGIVYLQKSKSPNTQLRAVKKIPQQLMKANKVDIKRELHTLIEVSDHVDRFVEFYGWYEDKAADFIYLAMEFVPHGDLGQYLRDNGPEAKRLAQSIARQLVEGIAILHEKQICHRDLKPQNVLIASLVPIHVKLADFGVSKSTIGTDLRTRHGTVSYMAPELLGLLPRELRGVQGYTTAVDLWALGCLVHQILTLETPFLDRTLETEFSGVSPSAMNSPPPTDTYQMSEFCKGNVVFPTEALQGAQVSASGIQFIKKLLVADPRARMSAAEALKNEWIKAGTSVPRPRFNAPPPPPPPPPRLTPSMPLSKFLTPPPPPPPPPSTRAGPPPSALSTVPPPKFKAPPPFSPPPRPPTGNGRSSYPPRTLTGSVRRIVPPQKINSKPPPPPPRSTRNSPRPILSPTGSAHRIVPPPPPPPRGAPSIMPPSNFSSPPPPPPLPRNRTPDQSEVDSSWQALLEELKDMGLTEQQIADNEEFIRLYIKEKEREKRTNQGQASGAQTKRTEIPRPVSQSEEMVASRAKKREAKLKR